MLALNSHVGVGDLESVGTALGAIIASPFHDKFVVLLLSFAFVILVPHCDVFFYY